MFGGRGRRLGGDSGAATVPPPSSSSSPPVDTTVVNVRDEPTDMVFVRVPQMHAPVKVSLPSGLRSTTIAELKRMFLSALNAAMSASDTQWRARNSARIIFRGRQMSDELTLHDAGLESGDHCHAVVSVEAPAQASDAAPGGSRVERLLGFSRANVDVLRAQLARDVGALRRSARRTADPEAADVDDAPPPVAGPTRLVDRPEGGVSVMRGGTTCDQVVGWLVGFFLGPLALPFFPLFVGETLNMSAAIIAGVFCNIFMALLGAVPYDVPVVV